MVAPALFCFAFAAACGASTQSADIAESVSAASDLVESDSQDRVTSGESTATPMPEPSSTPAPTATTAPAVTSVPTAVPTTAPTATPVATATSAPRPIIGLGPMSPDAFAVQWVFFSEILADDDPAQMAPLQLPVAVTSTSEELDLDSYPISDGVLLATSLAGDSIDGYVLLFDSGSPEALRSIVPLGLSIGEVLVLRSVIDAIFLGDPFVEPDVPMAFRGELHGLELLRTGADPVNDPLWMFTAVPNESSVSHDRLRRAAAQAAADTF